MEREHLERLAEASKCADSLSRLLRDCLCSPAIADGPQRDRLRWWSYAVDDASEDLSRLERETWSGGWQ